MAGTNLPGNTLPAVGAPWGVTPLLAPQRPQSPPSSYGRPVPDQPRGHVTTVQSAVVSASDFHRDIFLFIYTHLRESFLAAASECCW